MLDLALIGEFSRNHCIAICAFLVPANLLTTLVTLILFVRDRPRQQIRTSVIVATSFALILSLHVATWWMIGIVREETFILLGLALTCLGLNFGTTYYSSFEQAIAALGNQLGWDLEGIVKKFASF